MIATELTADQQEAMRQKESAKVEEAVEFGSESAFPEFKDLPVIPGVGL